jgi:glycosyltransferase involved in cell wall biosynthesis
VLKLTSEHAKIKVSVAMCTYNGERFLAVQLDSILNQSYQNIEVVIVDDGSTDNTMAILRGYEERDSRIRVYQNTQNIGFVKNFERAIATCEADYIALADQDDIWFENKIADLMAEIEDSLLIYSRVALIDADGQPLGEEFPGSSVKRVGGSCALSLMLTNCVTGHACLIRRELFEQARPALASMPYHDQWLALVAAANGRLKASDKVLSYYRSHGENIVLKNKSKKKQGERRYTKVMRKLDCHLNFVSAVLASGVLAKYEESLLQRYLELSVRNKSLFYNGGLKRFLLEHQAVFFASSNKTEKLVGKMCRGKWFFILFPFA